MRACAICHHFLTKLPDGEPMCSKFRDTPLSIDRARTSESLRLLKCSPSSSGVERFRRTILSFPLLPGENLYCCCPGALDLVDEGVLTALRSGDATGMLEFRLGGVPVAFCPCCGAKLQSDDAVKAKAERMRRAKRR